MKKLKCLVFLFWVYAASGYSVAISSDVSWYARMRSRTVTGAPTIIFSDPPNAANSTNAANSQNSSATAEDIKERNRKILGSSIEALKNGPIKQDDNRTDPADGQKKANPVMGSLAEVDKAGAKILAREMDANFPLPTTGAAASTVSKKSNAGPPKVVTSSSTTTGAAASSVPKKSNAGPPKVVTSVTAAASPSNGSAVVRNKADAAPQPNVSLSDLNDWKSKQQQKQQKQQKQQPPPQQQQQQQKQTGKQ